MTEQQTPASVVEPIHAADVVERLRDEAHKLRSQKERGPAFHSPWGQDIIDANNAKADLFTDAADLIARFSAERSGLREALATFDWSDEALCDLISDAIGDSMDMDWTYRDGAKAALAALQKEGLLRTDMPPLPALSTQGESRQTGLTGWQDIATAPKNTDHMRPILLFWKNAGIGLGWYDVDDDFAERPASWRCPETGWICEGDQCIPMNQEDCTHWMPLPAAPTPADGGGE